MSERPTATVRLGWLLQLPGDLEGQFWAASDTQWLLCTMDLLAFMMVLPNVIAAVLGRVNKSLPQGVELPMGAKAILMLYWLVSVLPVGLMLLNFQHYKKHRTKLAVASRLYRLVGAALLTHPVTVLGYVTQVAAVQQAALAGKTVKSLLTNTLLPTILWVQQSNCLLSFRLALFFQLGLFGVAVAWAQGMPCYLPLPTAPAGSGNWSCNSTHFAAKHMAHMAPLVLTPPAGSCMPCNSSAVLEPAGKVHAGLGQHAVAAAHAGAAFALQESGTRVCQGMQLLHELLLVPFGGVAVAPAVGRATLCDGAAAFQTLFVFVAALLLLVVVPASVYFIELHYKQKWLKRNGITVVPNCSVQAAPGSASSSSQAQLRWQPWRPVLSTYALLALPVCCCWALSESVSAWIGGCCMVPMGNGAIAWMSNWF